MRPGRAPPTLHLEAARQVQGNSDPRLVYPGTLRLAPQHKPLLRAGSQDLGIDSKELIESEFQPLMAMVHIFPIYSQWIDRMRLTNFSTA